MSYIVCILQLINGGFYSKPSHLFPGVIM